MISNFQDQNPECIPKDSVAGREQFTGLMEARRRTEGAGEYAPQGWCLGSEEFRQELLAQVSQLASPRHAGEEIRESALAKANRITQPTQRFRQNLISSGHSHRVECSPLWLNEWLG
jgi:hypothetical protein